MRTIRRSLRGGTTVRQPNRDEPPPLADVYDDARSLVSDYPVARLPRPVRADPAAGDLRWRALIDEMTRHPELSGRYCD